jgi:hypothetical protein
MDLILKRTQYREDGIFGELKTLDGRLIAVTLEHAYPIGSPTVCAYQPKVAPGNYRCAKHAPNRLPYETYMLESVPDFQGQPVSGILIHILNFNEESEGCIGVGQGETFSTLKQEEMITASKLAFDNFMSYQLVSSQVPSETPAKAAENYGKHVDAFNLTVVA